MKRTIGAFLLTLGLVAGLPLQAADAAPKVKPCSIVTGAEGGYNTLNGVPTVAVNFNLPVKACGGVTYTVTAVPTDGSATVGSSDLNPNQELGSYTIQVAVPGAPTHVCVSLITSGGGDRTFDHVPSPQDRTCDGGALFELDGGSSGGFMR